jgi:hypothetical protein
VAPLFNGGDSLLQPTYVSDVVDAIVKLVEEGVRIFLWLLGWDEWVVDALPATPS